MKRIFLTLLVALSIPLTLADTWPTGHFVLETEALTVDVTILDVSDSDIHTQVSWSGSNELGLMAGSVTGHFTLTQPNEAHFQLSPTSGDVFMLKQTTFGELVFRFQSDARPELNTSGFLKPDQQAPLSFSTVSVDEARDALPPLSRWVDYLNDDIWPYWRSDEAARFVGTRCNDGSLPDLDTLCPELRPEWIRAGLDQNYIRMVSRQTYAYGVIFHLTGNTDALALMNEGVQRILQRINDDGSVVTHLQDGAPLYLDGQQTSQDIAYAQVGLAMAYYLTGDEDLLRSIDRIKQHLFSNYRNEHWNMLAWTLTDQQPGDAQQQELVAQLDQLNAYLLLMYPLLPEPMQRDWQVDIEWLVTVLLDSFHQPEQHRFAGQLVNGQANQPGERHNDYGHSVKSYWMILLAGERLNRPDWIETAETGIRHITEQAFRFHSRPEAFSTWAYQSYSRNSSWWEYAELTQASATMALRDDEFVRYLPEAYRGWFGQFVDPTWGGVWMGAGGGAKQHLWKNAYHETELALVAAITTAKLQKTPYSLFFAEEQTQFQPYFFDGEVQTVVPAGLGRQRVIFSP
ncbi:hypothetical protein [Reinekea blandensis]|uniref:Uncharacterized protein n=1 Tax=Reinekea blandensis MED297 TaxID=314283 RepID=A4B9X9_9GAMM|nr:hypothetical protein [Reinekea blandensis]EAR11430.1 hypothetical protein MED297_21122 [Reinekea sp. MED297] [Reinekea blandensis MED297]